MSSDKKQKSFKQLSDLKEILSQEELLEQKENENLIAKAKYQEEWVRNTNGHRKMVAKKNRKWLLENNHSSLKDYIPFPDVYKTIDNLFKDDKTKKYMIHIITNFMPLNRTQQVFLFREENTICPFTNYKLTDLNGILVGNRDRHIGFSGANSNVFLSGIGLQELNRYVLEHTYTYETREGQIINFALDNLRKELSNKKG
jgi:hypothetical protein